MHGTPAVLRNLQVAQPFKRAGLGLYHGKTKQYGNSVPFSLNKTRRTWMPNAHSQSLYSQILRGWIRVNMTARTLRTVDKVGGIDNYLLNTKAELLGYEGMRLRVMLREHKTRLSAEAAAVPETPQPST